MNLSDEKLIEIFNEASALLAPETLLLNTKIKASRIKGRPQYKKTSEDLRGKVLRLYRDTKKLVNKANHHELIDKNTLSGIWTMKETPVICTIDLDGTHISVSINKRGNGRNNGKSSYVETIYSAVRYIQRHAHAEAKKRGIPDIPDELPKAAAALQPYLNS